MEAPGYWGKWIVVERAVSRLDFCLTANLPCGTPANNYGLHLFRERPSRTS